MESGMTQLKNEFPSIETIESTFIKAISNLADKQVSAEATLNSLGENGIDSLCVMQVICEVEQLLGITITDDVFYEEDITIAQLAKRVNALGLEENS
jgi:acyl carrier protein